ncbi:hypothetical protein [Psychrobium sp. 1_MG-2023]|uniref:hypothetical protein n=1 Tax=Psychrobium sp. 1_MG-2023 TaxID=3062624 RepID=UPI000C3465FF|nr:hypothetical protein [Psychrobium sp. 1_MG-2023]MDP2562311.1 hypothetical protein [Psychrobium sp. 1_MG-2023]PKF54693.1 hypothetical protein CW748_15660 [Alteromonadales bacterium alter-6D02]
MKYFAALVLLTASLNTYASDTLSSFFVTHDTNGESTISSVGSGIIFKDDYSHMGFAVNTSLGNAEVLTEDNYIEEYVAWELGLKFGYFSDISVYGEIGIDLGELIFNQHKYDDHDLVYDNDDYFNNTNFNHYHNEYDDRDHDHSNSLDAYIGVGAGINLGHLELTGHVRLRQIDGDHWSAAEFIYSGVQMSVSF